MAGDPLLEPLAKGLESPATWRETLAKAPSADETGPARACRHYLAGAAAFFLSERAPELAPRAVEQLLAARLLAPAEMEHLQARKRLETSLRRLGAVSGVDTLGTLGVASIRAASGGTATYVLRPEKAESLALTLPVSAAGTLLLPPGAWRATVNGRCGGSDIRFTVGTTAVEVTLPEPPPCRVELRPMGEDGAALAGARVLGPDGAPLPADTLTERSGAVTVEAPGYLPGRVDLAGASGVRAVTLKRCPVDLQVEATPADARATGAGPAPWGKRRVTVERAGYRSVSAEVEVPAPERCDGAQQRFEVSLDRPVVVSVRTPDGGALEPSVLLVEGVQMSPAGFDLAPGQYDWEARFAEAQPARGALEVPHCGTAECPPVRLDITARPVRSTVLPWVVTGTGGVLLAGGLVSGAAAMDAQSKIDEYKGRNRESVSMDTLIQQRDDGAEAANVLVGTGLAVAAAGLLWYWLGED